MNLMGKRFYDDGATGGGGDPAPAEPPVQPPVTGEPSAPDPKPDVDVQAEIDKRAKAIKKEASKEAVDSFLQELGFEKKDELSALVKAMREREEADKSEAQKLQDKLDAIEAEKQTLVSTLETERQARRKADMLSSVASLVRTAGVKSAREQDALALLNKDGALDALLPDEGNFDSKDAQKLVDSFKETYKEWFTPDQPGVPSNADASNPSNKDEAMQKARENLKPMYRNL